MTDPKIFEKFQGILEDFGKFQKFRQMKESGKMLEPKVNYRNISPVNHDWLKLSFSRKGIDSVMRGKFQVISMQYGELPHEQTYRRGSPWKL